MKKKKQQKLDFSDGIYVGIVTILLTSLLGIGIYWGYQEYTIPDWQECYVNETGDTFAKVDSIYNDEQVIYYYADLRDYTFNWKQRDTQDFLDIYSKTSNCEFFNISKQIIKLQESKK